MGSSPIFCFQKKANPKYPSIYVGHHFRLAGLLFFVILIKSEDLEVILINLIIFFCFNIPLLEKKNIYKGALTYMFFYIYK